MPTTTAPPATVAVGAHVYEVLVGVDAVNALSIDQRKAMNAHTDLDALVIHVRGDLPHTRNAEVLLHEIIHAALDAAGLTDPSGPLGDSDGDLEEQVVVGLAPVLLAVVRNNPALIGYLTS